MASFFAYKQLKNQRRFLIIRKARGQGGSKRYFNKKKDEGLQVLGTRLLFRTPNGVYQYLPCVQGAIIRKIGKVQSGG